ncbi:MAG: hypothetical protein ABSC19_16465 [Syntrophorhabdales bacterium]|jgi:hypothetical protein
MDDIANEKPNWLERTIDSLLSSKEEVEASGTPEEMIDETAGKAFKISTALGLIPGPIGMAAILPEIAALTRLQVTLIHRIARHHHTHEKVSREIILLILGNAMGVAAGEALVRNVGSHLVVRSVNTQFIRGITRKIGTRMIDSVAERAVGRWIPMLTAPLFGYFSRSLTIRIGREAERLFSKGIGVEPVEGGAS